MSATGRGVGRATSTELLVHCGGALFSWWMTNQLGLAFASSPIRSAQFAPPFPTVIGAPVFVPTPKKVAGSPVPAPMVSLTGIRVARLEPVSPSTLLNSRYGLKLVFVDPEPARSLGSSRYGVPSQSLAVGTATLAHPPVKPGRVFGMASAPLGLWSTHWATLPPAATGAPLARVPRSARCQARSPALTPPGAKLVVPKVKHEPSARSYVIELAAIASSVSKVPSQAAS